MDHLKRCKTSIRWFRCTAYLNFDFSWFISQFQFITQGDGEDIWGSIQRSSSYDPRISPGTPGDVPATPFQFPRQWHPAKPRTGTSICFQFRFCTVATICLSFDFSRLTKLHQNIPLSKDVESILRTVFHVGSSNFSCQVYWSVFCTYDTFHISNSIRYFWASVWLMPDPSRWYEPFGESLSRLTVDSKTMSEFTLLN